MSAPHTPGPWGWMGKGYGEDLRLSTTHSGRRLVMGFRRWGTQGAQPTFQVDGRMIPASELVRFEVGDGLAIGMKAGKADPSVYRYDIDGIDHPDARLIAAAPEGFAIIEQLEESFTADGAYQQFLPAMRAYLAKARGEA